MSLHHKLCHTLGGTLNLPHADTHAVLLPHTFAYNSPAVPSAARDLVVALQAPDGDAVKGLNEFLEKLGVHRTLEKYGMQEGDITRIASMAVSNPYSNPRKVEEVGIRELLGRAWAGEQARADL